MYSAITRKRVAVPIRGEPPMEAYLAYPSAPGRYPGVIVGMELFGVTPHIRSVADQVAKLGYLAVAPGFYHRIAAHVELAYDEAGRALGFGFLNRLSREGALHDVQATMDFLGKRPDFGNSIGFLGFSVGGHIGYLAATQLNLAACAVFYSGWLSSTDIGLSRPNPTLALTPGITGTGTRMVYFVGEDDHLVTCAQRQQIAGALAIAQVRHEMVIYPQTAHGFFCEERGTFHEASRNDAWGRTVALFASELSA